MASRSITIDSASTIDNPTDRQVEYRGEVDGDVYDFAIKYSALDVMSGADMLEEPAAAFPQLAEPIAEASLRALKGACGTGRIIVDEQSLARRRGGRKARG